MIGDSRITPGAGALRPGRIGGSKNIQPQETSLPQDGLGVSHHSQEPTLNPAQFQQSQATRKQRERQRHNMERQNEVASQHLAGAGSMHGTIAAANLKHPDGRWDLAALATKALKQYGLETDYPADVKKQVADIMAQVRPTPGEYVLPEAAKKPWVRDYRDKPLMSVDNGQLWTKTDPEQLKKDPSRDLDQLQCAEKLPDGGIRMTVAVSDIGAFVPKDSPLDRFMEKNTASVYTADKVFNLVPPELAEDVVSLNPGEDRLATVIEYTVMPDGSIKDPDVGQAIVKSQAKLDYSSVGAWLEGKAEPSPGMMVGGGAHLENLKLQAEASARLEAASDRKGALEFDSTETRIITEKGNAIGVEESEKNVATEMVENFMVTSNSVMSQFLADRGYATMERVVKPPEKWDRIQDLAKEYGGSLPAQPDGRALAAFMQEQKAKLSEEQYREFSVSCIKLIGRGEYQAVGPNDTPPGHFALGVERYAQTTASIRRGGDRVQGHQLRAALESEYSGTKVASPYTPSELTRMAENLNEKAQQIKKAERMAEKMVFGTMLESQIGKTFQGVVTGGKDGKFWVRISDPPVEGSLKARGNPKVGTKVNALLTSVDVPRGFIDFQQTKG
jgi:exoribonuclease-2